MGRADPQGARFIFAGRRWHSEDIYGHLKSTGEWVVMELPAVRENAPDLYWDVFVPDDLVCCLNEGALMTPQQRLERLQMFDEEIPEHLKAELGLAASAPESSPQ